MRELELLKERLWHAITCEVPEEKLLGLKEKIKTLEKEDKNNENNASIW